MQRLVYSPKAYVFIKDKDGVVRNVSDFVVSGSVTRRINQVSSAEIELRNPDKIFTNPKTGVPFMPMDPITIYLERLYGHPVRVFTGYLDKTPYYQLYPGTIRLEASCTLKRLLYRFFDIALPYTMSFLAEHGWVNANGQGRLLTPNGEFADDTKRDGGVLVIGDSLTVGSDSALRKKLKGATVISQGSEPTAWGIEQLEAQRRLPGTVVMAFGTNDSDDEAAFKRLVKKALDIVGPDRHLVWVNVWRYNSNKTTNEISGLNIVLDELAEENPNMSIVDWASMVRDNDVDISDNAHTDSGGYKKRAEAIAQTVGGKSEKARAIKIKQMTAQEGFSSIGELLMDTLVEIGGWDSDHVLIEQLPAELPDRLAGLYDAMMYESQAVKGEFSDMLKKMIGSGALGGSAYGSGGGDGGKMEITGELKELEDVIPVMIRSSNRHNIPPEMMIATWLIEWPSFKDTPGNPHYGWFQWDRKDGPAGSYQYGGVTQSRKNGCYDLGFASDSYAQAAAGWASKHPDLRNSLLQWTMKVQGVNGSNNPLYPQTWADKLATARNYISKYGKGTGSSPSTNAATTKRSERKGGNKNEKPSGSGEYVYPLEKKADSVGTPADHAGRGGSWQNEGWDLFVPVGTKVLSCADGRVTKAYLGTGALTAGWQISITADNGEQFFYNLHGGSSSRVQTNDKVTKGQVIGLSGDTNGAHLHWSVNDGWPNRGNVAQQVLGSDVVKGSAGSGGGGGFGGGSNTGDVLGDGAAQAFAATLELPGVMEMAEAMALQGHKSLMNDKPLMPFIQQLVEASLRSFQSMPNGDFFAFYPDYFGELYHHPPYWEIDDIEILDGGVDLTDDNLVTHMYVVGDTAAPFSGDALSNKMFTTGVVDIFSAFGIDVVDVRTPDETMTKAEKKGLAKSGEAGSNNLLGVRNLLERDQAVQFLQRYGPRPVVEDMPLVKNHVYEMFLAYQKFMLGWSRQFVTPFTFTFMPELYPGGKVGFPRHSLQMYIEEVTHSFDYSGGFTTTATLSAPSVYAKNAADALENLPPNMVEAIIEPVRGSAAP